MSCFVFSLIPEFNHHEPVKAEAEEMVSWQPKRYIFVCSCAVVRKSAVAQHGVGRRFSGSPCQCLNRAGAPGSISCQGKE